jgi:hypothetical protein
MSLVVSVSLKKTVSDIRASDQEFFRINIYQYYVRSDLLNAIVTDDIFLVPAYNTPYFTGSGNDNVGDYSCTYIKVQVADIAKSFSVSAINHFLLL